MSKKVLMILSIIFLLLCIMVTLILIFLPISSPNPAIENTTEQTFTVEYVKKVNSVASYIGVKETNYELVVFHALVSDFDALSRLSTGDIIFVRKCTKNSAGEVWELRADNVSIVSLDDSFKYVETENKKLLPVGIVFSVLFAVATVICFCGYKGVFSTSNIKNDNMASD